LPRPGTLVLYGYVQQRERLKGVGSKLSGILQTKRTDMIFSIADALKQAKKEKMNAFLFLCS
jgi:hypothetical protein